MLGRRQGVQLGHFAPHMAPREIFKYPHYMFAWYKSCVAPRVAIPRMIVSHVVIPRLPFYTRPSMTISSVHEWLLCVFSE